MVVVSVAPRGRAPQIAWSNSSALDALPAVHRWPPAPVTKGYPGFDEDSRLNSHGVLRVHVNVGPDRFTALIGYPPPEHRQRTRGANAATVDVAIPHPQARSARVDRGM